MQECRNDNCPDSCMENYCENAPLAMGYVPRQKNFHKTFELSKALEVGTIFPELCKPFCGRRGC